MDHTVVLCKLSQSQQCCVFLKKADFTQDCVNRKRTLRSWATCATCLPWVRAQLKYSIQLWLDWFERVRSCGRGKQNLCVMRTVANKEILGEEALPILQDSKGKCINSLEMHRDTTAKMGRVIGFHIRLVRMGNGKSNCRKGELLRYYKVPVCEKRQAQKWVQHVEHTGFIARGTRDRHCLVWLRHG